MCTPPINMRMCTHTPTKQQSNEKGNFAWIFTELNNHTNSESQAMRWCETQPNTGGEPSQQPEIWPHPKVPCLLSIGHLALHPPTDSILIRSCGRQVLRRPNISCSHIAARAFLALSLQPCSHKCHSRKKDLTELTTLSNNPIRH